MLIAQRSDIRVRPRGQLYGERVDANRRFAQAIDPLQARDRRPDLRLITGDLADPGRADEYTVVDELLHPRQMPVLRLPGKHDQRQALRQAFAGHAYLPASGPMHDNVAEHGVRIVAPDSGLPGRHHGHVDAPGLDWLRQTLAPDRPA